MLKSIKILFALLIFSLVAVANENQVFLDSANNAYSKGNFETAINYYEKIINNGYEATEVYYNLGNAYYKSNKIAFAILNYERALKIAPDDEDIKFNLKLANQRIVDKIEIVPQLFITEWKEGFMNSHSEKGWSLICIGLFSISLVLLAIYLMSNKLLVKQSCFGLALLFFLSSLFTFFIAKNQYKILTGNKEAIVVSSPVDVTSSPTENTTRIFVLHKGTKVSIIKTNADWAEIKLSNGNIGWVKTSDIIFI